MPSSGPPMARASSGRAPESDWVDWAATGSTSPRQTSWVPTTHSARLQALVLVIAEGRSVAASSQWSASPRASATASFWRCEGLGSGCWATVLRAVSTARSQLTGPS